MADDAASTGEETNTPAPTAATVDIEIPPDIPAAFPQRRRGRPPGRPNTTVREADYDDNALVRGWNAAKAERAITAIPVRIRDALSPDMLQHDTQRAIFALPSRQYLYFVQGWITARHVASHRPSYVNGLLIHSRGEDSPDECKQCAERRAKDALGPFLECRVLAGKYHNSCSNCKWFDNTSACSLYTGPKPSRKRKTKSGGDVGEEDGQRPSKTPDRGRTDLGPGVQAQQTSPESAPAEEVQFGEMQVDHDANGSHIDNVVDDDLAAQLLPDIQNMHA
ncbi:hypothetical protein QBC47DRAFT_383733 [Echria macrotheca]|uniref:Uncharacterized protein n=1 Tax=Echria macrotheca TaxID=438768 RepID=A0AAJ0BAN9_9PEZI|nr:hypothetical protein QBC47DRAFT_383733 [Echria macrotheca]